MGNGGSFFEPQAKQLAAFVEAWSGGDEGGRLAELEKFERSCATKRKLSPAVLEALASADLLHAPKHIRVASLVSVKTVA